MKLITKVLPFVVSTMAGFMVSFPIFMLLWNIQIEHRAYRCTDDVGFGFFCESMDTHRGAGDTVLPGWTWQKIEVTQALYEAGFLVLLLSIATAPAWAPKAKSHELAS